MGQDKHDLTYYLKCMIGGAEGSGGLVVGWAPTLIGYSLQGCGKFGFYEIFKDVFAGLVGNYTYNYWSLNKLYL